MVHATAITKFAAICALSMTSFGSIKAVLPRSICPPASEGDLANGVDVMFDNTCNNGGLGCQGPTCRLCKLWEGPLSGHLLKCGAIPTKNPNEGGCGKFETVGDLAQGIAATADANCKNGGLGCVSQTCRLCKLYDTDVSKHLFTCVSSSDSGSSATDDSSASSSDGIKNTMFEISGPEILNEDLDTGSSFLESDGNTSLSHGSSDSASSYDDPVSTTASPPSDSSNSPSSNASSTGSTLSDGEVKTVAPTTAVPTPPECVSSIGDIAVGVFAVFDPNCEFGGIGCYSGNCRFCKADVDTPNNAHFETCSSHGLVVDFEPPTTRPEVCGISDGDLAVGIDVEEDFTCQFGGLGCYNNHCRHCLRFLTGKSQHLRVCNNQINMLRRM